MAGSSRTAGDGAQLAAAFCTWWVEAALGYRLVMLFLFSLANQSLTFIHFFFVKKQRST